MKPRYIVLFIICVLAGLALLCISFPQGGIHVGDMTLRFPALADALAVPEEPVDTDTVAVLSPEEILYFQQLVRRVPVPDNVYDYAVNLVAKTRPHTAKAHDWVNRYLSWGAGPRASQYLIIGAKANALLTGKYSPDIEDVQRVAIPILRHRIIRNYTAEAEGISIEEIIKQLQ